MFQITITSLLLFVCLGCAQPKHAEVGSVPNEVIEFLNDEYSRKITAKVDRDALITFTWSLSRLRRSMVAWELIKIGESDPSKLTPEVRKRIDFEYSYIVDRLKLKLADEVEEIMNSERPFRLK